MDRVAVKLEQDLVPIQDKTWLDGPVASVKGKLEALERWTAWR